MMQRVARGTYTVLIIEDDTATLEYLLMLLHLHGYGVQTARNGSQGLLAATARTYDAILSDWRLPDIDGLQVCRLLREEHGITTPMVIMTADRESALEMAVHAVGATVLLKPFEPDALLKQIAAMVAPLRPNA